MANDEKDLDLKEGDEIEGSEGGAEGESKADKPRLTEEQIKGIKQRKFTKLAKELGIELPGSKSEEVRDSQNNKGFDYAEKSFLKASGIHKDEYDFVREVMSSTGKSLDDVLESRYFQAELKERRELRASKDAIPSGSKRAAPTTRNEVEYWLMKGELPPADQRELRHKVVQAKIAKAKSESQFTNNPIVGR